MNANIIKDCAGVVRLRVLIASTEAGGLWLDVSVTDADLVAEGSFEGLVSSIEETINFDPITGKGILRDVLA